VYPFSPAGMSHDTTSGATLVAGVMIDSEKTQETESLL
jgi:hypothetical protein